VRCFYHAQHPNSLEMQANVVWLFVLKGQLAQDSDMHASGVARGI
jgi:hypothetical protein